MAVGNHTLPTDILDSCTGMFVCFGEWASTVTTGAYWVLALLVFCAVLFMATARFGATRAFGFSTFVGMIGGIFLSVLTLIPWWVGSTFILFGVFGLIVMANSEN